TLLQLFSLRSTCSGLVETGGTPDGLSFTYCEILSCRISFLHCCHVGRDRCDLGPQRHHLAAVADWRRRGSCRGGHPAGRHQGREGGYLRGLPVEPNNVAVGPTRDGTEHAGRRSARFC